MKYKYPVTVGGLTQIPSPNGDHLTVPIDIPDVPGENLAIFRFFYSIEVGLRELIIELLAAGYGPHWWRLRLPPDVLQVYRDGRKYERTIGWLQLVPHHPLYYLDFPDLKKVIIRSDNWEQVFRHVFTSRDSLVGTLSELEPIRNKIAHNRKATTADFAIVRAAYEKIATGIGSNKFRELVKRCTLAEDILGSLAQLQQEANSAFELCKALKRLKGLALWDEIRTQWWFDADYLGYSVTGISGYFEALVLYNQLPRYRGSGPKIDAWLKEHDLIGKYSTATNEFSALLK